MADFESIADKATEYVFGELLPDERAEFEAMLDQSSELRAHVRELEEGALAIAAASPNAAPSKSAWREISRTIAHDQNRKRVRNIVVAIFKNGWAAAAVCVVGWVIFALSTDRPHSSSTKNHSLTSSASSEASVPAFTNLNMLGASNPRSLSYALTNQASSETTRRETTNLQNQLAGLQQQIAQLSNALTQHQAALNEPSRLKFFQLTPSTGVEKPILSPTVQRAFFYALAQELGWLSFTNQDGSFNFTLPPEDFGPTNTLIMDFVDLRTNSAQNPIRMRAPGAKDLAQNSNLGNSQEKNSGTADTSGTQRPILSVASSSPTSTVIPAFTTGSTLFFAVDPSMALPDTQILVTAGLGSDHGQEVIRTIDLSDAPLVVATGTGAGALTSISFLTTSGGSNLVYAVFTPAPNP